MGSAPELGILSLPPPTYSLLLDPAITNQIKSFGHVTHSRAIVRSRQGVKAA